MRNAEGFKKILEDYCLYSGQMVNLKPVVHFSSRTLGHLWHMIRDRLGFTEHTGILQYLGVSITGDRL